MAREESIFTENPYAGSYFERIVKDEEDNHKFFTEQREKQVRHLILDLDLYYESRAVFSRAYMRLLVTVRSLGFKDGIVRNLRKKLKLGNYELSCLYRLRRNEHFTISVIHLKKTVVLYFRYRDLYFVGFTCDDGGRFEIEFASNLFDEPKDNLGYGVNYSDLGVDLNTMKLGFQSLSNAFGDLDGAGSRDRTNLKKSIGTFCVIFSEAFRNYSVAKHVERQFYLKGELCLSNLTDYANKWSNLSKSYTKYFWCCKLPLHLPCNRMIKTNCEETKNLAMCFSPAYEAEPEFFNKLA